MMRRRGERTTGKMSSACSVEIKGTGRKWKRARRYSISVGTASLSVCVPFDMAAECEDWRLEGKGRGSGESRLVKESAENRVAVAFQRTLPRSAISGLVLLRPPSFVSFHVRVSRTLFRVTGVHPEQLMLLSIERECLLLNLRKVHRKHRHRPTNCNKRLAGNVLGNDLTRPYMWN